MTLVSAQSTADTTRKLPVSGLWTSSADEHLSPWNQNTFWDVGGVGVQELSSLVLAEDLCGFAHVWELEHSDRV